VLEALVELLRSAEDVILAMLELEMVGESLANDEDACEVVDEGEEVTDDAEDNDEEDVVNDEPEEDVRTDEDGEGVANEELGDLDGEKDNLLVESDAEDEDAKKEDFAAGEWQHSRRRG
jgi:hypothetical protein